jgi:hypothetical protein
MASRSSLWTREKDWGKGHNSRGVERDWKLEGVTPTTQINSHGGVNSLAIDSLYTLYTLRAKDERKTTLKFFL